MPPQSGPPTRPPSVDALARSLVDTGLSHPLLVDAARAAIAAGDPDSARERALDLWRSRLRSVINATGVLLHTNLGRAPVGYAQAADYTNLEFDLVSGQRGSRSAHTGSLLARAAGAEAALVVNNGAAAVMVVLAALARGRGVAVSRGELVEIGGGFRIPEVLTESGARLVEVGTTNRTRPSDFETALLDEDADLAVLLKVHQSNYQIVGFTESVSIGQLVAARRAAAAAAAAAGTTDEPDVPIVFDLGSGLLDAACPWLATGPPAWLSGEPAVRQSFEAGADLITFSGDKLLGGPQAGIIAGRADLVAACARHPLARALRPGSLVLGALHQTALAYLERHGEAIPFWHLASIPVAELRTRAHAIIETIPANRASPVLPIECASVPGGGTLPGVEIASFGLSVVGDHTDALRQADPPIIARVHDGRTILDLRTVARSEDGHLAAVLASLPSAAPNGE